MRNTLNGHWNSYDSIQTESGGRAFEWRKTKNNDMKLPKIVIERKLTTTGQPKNRISEKTL